MKTHYIQVQGIVQGVGFRPFIYNLCTKKKLKGKVSNTSNGVQLYVNIKSSEVKSFLQQILNNAPPLAKITKTKITQIDYIKFSDFLIIESTKLSEKNLKITPDVATCKECYEELFDKKNRRYHYPFITCTNCGPRYSIATNLPYDRETTTMDSFLQCDKCVKEYTDPENRRFFSQTNSCKDCRIEMSLFENGVLHKNFTDLKYIVDAWNKGEIVAIKSTGGYLLTCDATNPTVIKRLRTLKNRPFKPFALMYHDLYELGEDVEMGIGEMLELESVSAPIVLLSIKADRMTPIAIDEIAPRLSNLGVMLPSTPLFHQLMKLFKTPIICTSANLSNSTIVYKDFDAIKILSKISDLILLNNRDIVIPQDDSVVRYSSIKSYRSVYRRSKGLAPTYINSNLKLPKKDVLAMGAMLKSTFTLLTNSNLHISQYIGNTINFDAQENYKLLLNHFKKLFEYSLKTIIVDKHPEYFTTKLGEELANKNDLELVKVQHHKAHFYAVLGENDLLNSQEKILGVIFDGTGLGDDGHIWGGEFFIYIKGQVERVHHLNLFPFILGDKMIKEPRISALAMSANLDIEEIKRKFTKTELSVYQKLIASSKLKCTSIGRLFDAVSSIIFDVDVQTYEGEAAMVLESAAYRYFRKNNFTKYYTYIQNNEFINNFIENIITSILEDKKKGFENDFIAAKFHISIAHYIMIIAKKQNVKKVVFSGGVFQNMWLIELILSFMKQDFELFFHKELSPNDECISFGQLMYYRYSKEL